MTYNEILEKMDTENNEQDNDQMLMFRSVLDHRKNAKGRYEVLIDWEDGDTTWEPLTWMVKQDPITLAMYGLENDLLDTKQWRRLKRHAKIGSSRYIRNARVVAAAKKRANKYKFGVLIPNDYKQAVAFDENEGDTQWKEASDTEIGKIHEYNVFKDWGERPPPEGYKRITVHMIFDVKYDGRRRA